MLKELRDRHSRETPATIGDKLFFFAGDFFLESFALMGTRGRFAVDSAVRLAPQAHRADPSPAGAASSGFARKPRLGVKFLIATDTDNRLRRIENFQIFHGRDVAHRLPGNRHAILKDLFGERHIQ